MSLVLRLLLSSTLVLLASCSHAEESGANQAIAGEIIIKFAQSTAIDQLVIEAFASDSALSDVESSVAGLSKDIQQPFRFSRLTSGHEVVVEVLCDARTVAPESKQIVTDLVAELNARQDVSYAQPNFAMRHYDE